MGEEWLAITRQPLKLSKRYVVGRSWAGMDLAVYQTDSWFDWWLTYLAWDAKYRGYDVWRAKRKGKNVEISTRQQPQSD